MAFNDCDRLVITFVGRQSRAEWNCVFELDADVVQPCSASCDWSRAFYRTGEDSLDLKKTLARRSALDTRAGVHIARANEDQQNERWPPERSHGSIVT